MLTIEKRILAFAALGEILRTFCSRAMAHSHFQTDNPHFRIIHKSISQSVNQNPWFMHRHLLYSISAIGNMLTPAALNIWLNHYQLPNTQQPKQYQIGVVMAGNIPAVGFHDFLCVLTAGARFSGKPSSGDLFLLPAIAQILCDLENEFADWISFEPSSIDHADAIIATGSNNTARYFEFNFGHKPHIFRKNRNGIAVLTGNETQLQLEKLTDDIFLHFGLGCRNVSKIYAPENYDFALLLAAMNRAGYVTGHQPYMNNYLFNRAVLTLQKQTFIDNGFCLLVQSHSLTAQPATLNYEYYHDLEALEPSLVVWTDQIQCIVGSNEIPFATTSFGETQQPGLSDYADGVDTLKFVLNLKSGI